MSARFNNFGQNVVIDSCTVIVPRTMEDVVACLQEYGDREIRVLGSLHSWSEAALPGDVALDLRHLNQMQLVADPANGGMCVEAGAGCTVERLLDYLHDNGRYTLPVYGIIGKQTIGGAISTSTHGSGRPSMSHYVVAASVAAYDEEFRATIYRWDSGAQLAAVRCGLGCTGVILSVRLRVERDFQIEERGAWFSVLDSLLDEARHYPRTQFYLMPWSWRWYAQFRRPVDAARERTPGILARVLRMFRLGAIDVLLNGAIRYLAATPRRRRRLSWVFETLMPVLAPSGVRVVDESRRLLTMRHDLWTHVECEIFVPAEHVRAAAAFVEWTLRCSSGEKTPPDQEDIVNQFGAAVITAIDDLRGEYLHDYPITFRRVLRDDTLISMTSGATDEWYAISLITYQRDLTPFLRLTRFLAGTMAGTLGARPHWGKICPLLTGELAALYPRLPEFRAFCASVDPAQVFVNDFSRLMLGFDRADRKVPFAPGATSKIREV